MSDLRLPDSTALRAVLVSVGFSDTWIERLVEVGRTAMEAPDVWLAWQDEMNRVVEGRGASEPCSKGLDWQVLALALRLHGLERKHSELRIDPTISSRTRGDLARWADAIDRQTVPGRALPLAWFRNHLHGNLLEIGCLQFVPGPFGAPFRLYRRRDLSGDLAALAHDGIPCDSEGWPSETKEPAFVTEGSEDRDGYSGHLVRPETGAISQERVILYSRDWEQLLTDGDTVLHVHIPEGSLLSEAGCLDAFRRAEECYRSVFPEISWRAFYCTTWMLDPALDPLLDPSSRIAAFARQFRRATMRHPDGRQIVERVLGNALPDLNFQPTTSLQRKVCEHLSAGGVFRTTGGYRVPEGCE